MFTDEDLIHSYSRAQAIADGALYDVSETAREAGTRWPVAITQRAWWDCVTWTRTDYPQDESARLWDVCWMMTRRFASLIRRGFEGEQFVIGLYRVPNEGRETLAGFVTLKVAIGPDDLGDPCLTIMLPEED